MDKIFDIALRAPDHGRVRPSRYLVIKGEARKAYADLLANSLKRREPATTEDDMQKLRGKFVDIPLIVAVGAKLKAGTNCGSCIPEMKRLIAQVGGEDAAQRQLAAAN